MYQSNAVEYYQMQKIGPKPSTGLQIGNEPAQKHALVVSQR